MFGRAACVCRPFLCGVQLHAVGGRRGDSKRVRFVLGVRALAVMRGACEHPVVELFHSPCQDGDGAAAGVVNSTALLLRALSLLTHGIAAARKEHRYKGLAHRKRQFIPNRSLGGCGTASACVARIFSR